MNTVITTKEQERNALAKIREIVENLGEYSYVGTAFKGCFEIAEENIKYDFCDSMEARLALATRETDIAIQERKSLTSENEALKNKIVRLEEELEKEQEWKEYEFAENVKQADYENLAKCSGVQQLDDEEAIDLINAEYGFEKNKIKIIRSVFVYEKDRHGRVRFTKEKRERNPLYVATDWNYIRFDCCGMSYEMKDGQLNFYVD